MNGSQGDDADVVMEIAGPSAAAANNSSNADNDDDDAVMSSSPKATTEKESGGREGDSVVSVDSTAIVTSQEAQDPPHQATPQVLASRVPEIWSSFFRRLEQIEQLEMRVEERVSQSRRRIMNLLEQTPSHRRTHLRMFVSHFFDKFKGIWTLVIEGKLLVGNIDHANAAKVDSEGVMSARVVAEGKEDEQKRSKKKRPNDKPTKSSGEKDSSNGGAQSSGTAPGGSAATNNPATASATPDRSHPSYRIGEKEEEPVQPLVFTHCFDKINVTFRTIYQPRVAASGKTNISLSSASSAKKSRSNKRKSSGQQVQEEPAAVSPKLLKASDPTKLVWDKNSRREKEDTPETQRTDDCHGFFVQYNNHFSERPPPPGMRFHSIVAKIELYPSRPGTGIGTNKFQFRHQQDVDAEPLYQIVHPVLAKRFFPRHVLGKSGDGSSVDGTGGARSKPSDSDGTKTGGNEGDPQKHDSSHSPAGSDEPIPLENDIRVPSFLTYNEISMSIFRYIQDNRLHDPTDRSNILCDKLLKEIFDVESMSFGQLKQLLIQKDLIRRSGAPSSSSAGFLSPQKSSGSNPSNEKDPVMPVVLTYVLNEQTTSPHVPAGHEVESVVPSDPEPANASATARRRAAYSTPEDPDHNPTVLSFDMDVAIPSFFNYRARELLRRVKKREFEYTTCRTKARYLLVAAKGNEDTIKTRIEKAVSGQGYEADNIPVMLALAKAAMPHSEAREAAQIDARTCDVVGRVEEANRSVGLAWEEVEAIRDAMVGSGGTR
ncbi:unnamed protein product [Pseudo-nitzschia multistriata]|uniref:DM2 domain-containing protein n=1 Tax=Pseudo-nitzschia multistriata TaxID=183589 RepID=A0A448ZMX2_9STRA|nr:unnamed protein product [Pseudo-nitzschia multistriata]